MGMAAGFLKREQKLIFIQKIGKASEPKIYLQPFIEGFSHRITPAMIKKTFSMVSAPTAYISGLSENIYELRLAVPAYSRKSAYENWETVNKLKQFVNPSIADLVSSQKNKKIYFQVFNLTGLLAGTLMSIQETIVTEQGWVEWKKGRYPKLMRITLTFMEDIKLMNALSLTRGTIDKRKTPKKSKKGVTPKTSTDPPPPGPGSEQPTSPAGRAQRVKTNKALESTMGPDSRPEPPPPLSSEGYGTRPTTGPAPARTTATRKKGTTP